VKPDLVGLERYYLERSYMERYYLERSYLERYKWIGK